MPNPQNDSLLQLESSCGSMLYELKIIWDEVGETESERDKILLELKTECLELYKKKVHQANKCRDQLRQNISDVETELAAICSSLGEPSILVRQSDPSARSLKTELNSILSNLEEMRKRKCNRRKHFSEVIDEIKFVSNELYLSSQNTRVDENDLSLAKLEDLHTQLHLLQKQKSERLKRGLELLDTIKSLCLVLGKDYKQTVSEINSCLEGYDGKTKNISNDTFEQLTVAIKQLREIKLKRMQKLQDFATTLLELWNLMDTPMEEQQMFQNITSNVAASELEITEPNTLSIDFMNHVEAEVRRLEDLKRSKMKELVYKKNLELEEICRKSHIVLDSNILMEDAIQTSQSVTLDNLLEQVEHQISKIKEEAFDRKEILEKVEKWKAACEEESWLEEYNMDENRYNAGRGTHLSLKRAEKARSIVSKIPAMIDVLASKVISWKKEKGMEFVYDGINLLFMLEDYNFSRQVREEGRRRQRDLKRLQGQLIYEQESTFGSKPSSSKPQSGKKTPRTSGGGGANGKKVFPGGAMCQLQKSDQFLSPKASTPRLRPNRKNNCLDQNDQLLPQMDDDFPVSITGDPNGADLMPRVPFSPLASNNTQCEMECITPMGEANCVTNTTSHHLGFEETEYSFEERRAGFALPVAKLETPV